MSLKVGDKLCIVVLETKIYLVNTDYNKVLIVYYPHKERYAFMGDFGLSIEELGFFTKFCDEYNENH